MSNLVIKVNSGLTAQNARNAMANSSNKQSGPKFLRDLGRSLIDSDGVSVQLMNDDAAQATATITFSGTGAADDTIVVNGVTFTAVASGATGNQWNVGGTATLTAVAVAAAISTSATALVSNNVYATSAAGVVTVKAKNLGLVGNTNTVAEGVDSGNAMVVSSARLIGGTDETSTSISSKSW